MKHNYLLLILLLPFLAMSQLTNNLLAIYDFNGNVDDVSGQGFNATPYNVTFIDDRYGNPESAAYFNGVDSYVELPNVDALKTPLPVSFSFWIRYDSADYLKQVVFNTSFEENRAAGVWMNSTSADAHYAVNFGNGTYNFTEETRQTFVSNSSVQVGEWHHVCVSVTSATEMRIWFDRVDLGGYYAGYGGDLVYSLNPGCLGRHDRNMDGPADYFEGALDNVSYFARTFVQSDVDALYDDALSVKQNNDPVVAIYPNPASDKLNVRWTNAASSVSYKVYNAFGSITMSGNIVGEKLDVSSLATGIYMIQLTDGTNEVTRRIVKK
ncbi:T9SS type A sorting domain-containing protein [Flavobacterium silvaticum]|uniref:T9SS type A sorting domain-containing protein n=1 Tax=Flavobacterium silvaticum TaxID=1852020 RepID=A0A972FPU5_9FLAO|nr:LamG-like jellyroll fold domain-containing protein [Flavobacterium silvaticum]NMH29642.1 T9SS type A sorting domain-containing protein [Flavobacterium silvaticum]